VKYPALAQQQGLGGGHVMDSNQQVSHPLHLHAIAEPAQDLHVGWRQLPCPVDDNYLGRRIDSSKLLLVLTCCLM
jgi:hypothetical protein